MTRAAALVAGLLAAGSLRCADAQAQARGPSAKQVREEGQKLTDAAESRARNMETYRRLTGIEPEVLASTEPLDEAGNASRNEEQAAWLAQLVGRFRIGGRVEKRDLAFLEASPVGVPRGLSGEISGVADCAAIGAGPGVHCIINARWPVIEPISATGARGMMGPPEASERVGVFRPAVLVLGLLPETAEIRASMVTDDSVAHTWTGRLEANTLTARRSSSCMAFPIVSRSPPLPCFQPVQLTAEPDSRTIEMVHRAAGVTMKLVLQRDPSARPEKPMKTKKVK